MRGLIVALALLSVLAFATAVDVSQAAAFSRQMTKLDAVASSAGSFTKKEEIYRLLEDVREQMVSRQSKTLKRLQAQIDYKNGRAIHLEKDILALKTRIAAHGQSFEHLNVKVAKQREVIKRVNNDHKALQLTTERMNAYINPPSVDATYSAIRISFKLGSALVRQNSPEQCLQVIPSATSGTSIWDWDDCTASAYDQQTFLIHHATGQMRMADDPLHTRIVAGAAAGTSALASDEPRANEDITEHSLSFNFQGKAPHGEFRFRGAVSASDGTGKTIGCLKYIAAIDDLMFSTDSDAGPCIDFTVSALDLSKQCDAIPVGKDSKASELYKLYTALAAVTKNDVPKYTFFAHADSKVDRVSEVDTHAAPVSLLQMRSEIGALMTNNKERRHKSSFLQDQELLFSSVLMTEDKAELVPLLNELLARMKEYLDQMMSTLKTEAGQCKARIASLKKQRASFNDVTGTMDSSVLPVKDSLSQDENQLKLIMQRLQAMKADLQGKEEQLHTLEMEALNTVDTAEIIHAKKDMFKQQLLSLESLRQRLSGILEHWSVEQGKVEAGLIAYPVFPYEGACNDTQSWATGTMADRDTDDLALVGGCAGCVAECPVHTAQRSFKLAQCDDGGLKVAQRCQRPSAKVTLGASVLVSNGCDATGNWGQGMSGAENLVRLGGAVNAISQCPSGYISTGWGINTCGSSKKQGLQFALQCAFTGFKLNAQTVLGKCTPSVHAWGSGTHYAWSHLAQMAAPLCPEGSFVSGMGVRHCDATKSTLQFVAQCSVISNIAIPDAFKADQKRKAKSLARQALVAAEKKQLIAKAKDTVAKVVKQCAMTKLAIKSARGAAKATAQRSLVSCQHSLERAKKVLKATRRQHSKSAPRLTLSAAEQMVLISQAAVKRAQKLFDMISKSFKQAQTSFSTAKQHYQATVKRYGNQKSRPAPPSAQVVSPYDPNGTLHPRVQSAKIAFTKARTSFQLAKNAFQQVKSRLTKTKLQLVRAKKSLAKFRASQPKRA